MLIVLPENKKIEKLIEEKDYAKIRGYINSTKLNYWDSVRLLEFFKEDKKYSQRQPIIKKLERNLLYLQLKFHTNFQRIMKGYPSIE